MWERFHAAAKKAVIKLSYDGKRAIVGGLGRKAARDFLSRWFSGYGANEKLSFISPTPLISKQEKKMSTAGCLTPHSIWESTKREAERAAEAFSLEKGWMVQMRLRRPLPHQLSQIPQIEDFLCPTAARLRQIITIAVMGKQVAPPSGVKAGGKGSPAGNAPGGLA